MQSAVVLVGREVTGGRLQTGHQYLRSHGGLTVHPTRFPHHSRAHDQVQQVTEGGLGGGRDGRDLGQQLVRRALMKAGGEAPADYTHPSCGARGHQSSGA